MFGRIPFEERHTAWRGVLDLLTGCYPAFVFGGSTRGLLPVFHFHDVTPDGLRPYLAYLAENGYRTVTSEAIAAFVRFGRLPGERCVALTFDDGWLSLWTVAFPLLREHGCSAIAYVSPGRIADAAAVRPCGEADAAAAPGANPFVSWPELRAMHASGCVDLQAHTYSHATVFCGRDLTGFVTPGYNPPIHLRPLLNTREPYRYLSPADLGCPLYPQRSRASDALRYFEPPEVRERCLALVREGGGPAFFAQPDWRPRLRAAAAGADGRFESPAERRRAILEELAQAREALNARLGTRSVRHMCFPFAICGRTAEGLLPEAGYETAFADRLFGVRAVRSGDRPYRLMRLKHQYLLCLPGKARQSFLHAWARAKRETAAE